MPYLNPKTNKILGTQLIVAEQSYMIINKGSKDSKNTDKFFKYVDQKYTNSDCQVFCSKNTTAYLLEA